MAHHPKCHITLTARVYEEDDQYVSQCIELPVSSCGQSVEEAFDALRDATTLYLNTLQAEREIERVFRKYRVKVIAGAPPKDPLPKNVKARPREYVTPWNVPVSAGC